MINNDIICAVSTAPGNGAIAVIRLSGKGSIKLTSSLFVPAKEAAVLVDSQPYSMHYGSLFDAQTEVDKVVVGIFKAPNSYTGEDVVEISCHGSVYIQNRILQLLVKNGARHAKPGEFTLRAFMSGKMDLSQAEAVADLIASTSAASHKVAMHQMRGGFSDELKKLRDRLLHFISMIELELDFSEEDVEFADRSELEKLLSNIENLITKLISSFELGNVIKNGIPVAIVGNTNVGKSTLLNQLLKEDKAIVSEIAGTTRDVIEDVINIEGVSFRFIDTAGIRHTKDTIESIGIERTFERVDNASLVLLLIDATNLLDTIGEAITLVEDRIGEKEKKLLVVINKIDQVEKKAVSEIETILASHLHYEYKIIKISAKTGQNLDVLIDELVHTVNLSSLNNNEVIVTNTRHFEALNHAHESLQRAQQGLHSGISSDLMAMDIRQVLHYLGEITGEITTDEVLGNIFKNFCIGK